jgi:galactose mutarotase-like enzyme
LLELGIEYSVSDAGLRVTTSATNAGQRACPYGSGAHPYLTLGTPSVDTLVLHAPGRTVFHFDDRGLPLKEEPADGTEYDFRTARTIGATKLDNAYTDLERDSAASPASSCAGPTAALLCRCGSTRRIPICSSSPATRFRA